MKQIFINLPVEDLNNSMHFYTRLGFTVNPLYTDEDQKCMVWSDSIYIMLQSRKFSNLHVNKTKVDIRKLQIPSFTLPVESNEKVNEMVENALQAGATEPSPALDEGFMQLRTIEDPDGYTFGIMCLDVEKFKNRIDEK